MPEIDQVLARLKAIRANMPTRHVNAEVAQQITFQAKTVENNCLKDGIVCPALVIAAFRGKLSDLSCNAGRDLVYEFMQAGDSIPHPCHARDIQIS